MKTHCYQSWIPQSSLSLIQSQLNAVIWAFVISDNKLFIVKHGVQIIDTEMLKDMIQGVQILCIKRAISS